MRYQPWKQSLHFRAQRTSLKFSKSFGVNSTFSRFYNATKQKSLEARKHQLEKRTNYASQNRIIKRTKEEQDKKERIHAFVELSRQYKALRAEQICLERHIKKRTAVLIKAVYRHKKSMQKLGKLERILTTYSGQLKQSLSDNILRSLNDINVETHYNKLNISRKVGGSEAALEFYTDNMPALVKKFATMRKYARRWMQKANVTRRHSSAMDLASMIRNQQRKSWDPLRENMALPNKEPIKPLITNEQPEREIALKSRSITSLQDTSSYRQELKNVESLKSVLATSEVVVPSEDSNKLAKRRNKFKSKQNVTSDIDENARRQRTGKRRGRGRRRSSRKSQQSTTSDGLKKGQRKRKGRRKSIKGLDSTRLDVKQARGSHGARKGRKRHSKEKSKLSKTSPEISSRARTLQSADDEKMSKENQMYEALQQMVAAQIKEEIVDGKTGVDKFKSKVVEFERAPSETQQQFRTLEEYWGVPLREDNTLQKLERLNSILDELIVEEEKKPRPSPSSSSPQHSPPQLKPVLSSRKVMPKPRKREIHDLEKLLILLKECKKCQKKQETSKTVERDCTVLSQKEYYDVIRNAAGLPDYFPEDSDFSLICSCNSFK